jgi:hypothetical protein
MDLSTVIIDTAKVIVDQASGLKDSSIEEKERKGSVGLNLNASNKSNITRSLNGNTTVEKPENSSVLSGISSRNEAKTCLNAVTFTKRYMTAAIERDKTSKPSSNENVNLSVADNGSEISSICENDISILDISVESKVLSDPSDNDVLHFEGVHCHYVTCNLMLFKYHY